MECEIREWRIDDAGSLAKILNNKKITNNLRDGIPFPYTVDDAKDYINFAINADKNSSFLFAVIYCGEVAGSIGIFRQNNIHYKTAELGYYVGEKFWNKGIATCAVIKACKFVFKNTDIIRIFAEPFSRNNASCKVLEKAGFSLEGTLHSNAIKNGITEDMKIYALLK